MFHGSYGILRPFRLRANALPLILNSTGPTPTRTKTTLGMRLSCNFVNGTRVHVYTRASLTDILARILAMKIAPCVGQVGEDPRACSARGERSYSCGKMTRELKVAGGPADILATILARKSARMSVSVSLSVSAPWNASFTARMRRARVYMR